ncbi:LCHN protein [Ceratobasidium sp. AG-Ba]|nr:LCHN protein [Ceratobasidium sp. AG-Ba]
MDAPSDVCALFHSAFHPTQGNIVDFQLKVRDDINLDGVEFSSLPSGLHLVDQDVIHFTKDGLCGIAVFRRRRIRENGLRGVRLGAVGVLIGSAPRARPWLHLPHLKRLAAHLEATPEDWEPLTEYFESHRQPDIIPAESTLDIPELWSGWEHELATASPNHPLHHLPCLLHAFGPSIMILFRFVLARRRVLIYTRVPTSASRSSFNSLASRQSADSNTESVVDQTVEAGAAPVVEPACVLARVAADICFGWKDGPGASDGPEVLGMIGLDAIEKLGDEGLKRTGWIACTTERIFLEKPHLYDLVVDLSPSLLAHGAATGPDDKPVLSISSPSSSGSSTFKLSQTRPTYSDLKVFNDIEKALYAQSNYSHPQRPTNQSNMSLGCACPAEHEDEEGWVVWDRWGQGCSSSSHGPGNRNSCAGINRHSCAAGMNTGPCSSGLNGHNQLQSPQSSSESARTWVDPWRIYEEVCMFCAGVCGWIGWGLGLRDRGGAGVHLDGPDEALRRQDPVSLQSISAPLPTASPTHHRQSRSLDHAEHDRRRAHRRAHVLELMTLFHKYAAFLHARLSDIIDSHDGQPQSSRKAKSSTASKTSFKFHSKSASQTQALLSNGATEERVLVLTSKDMLALDLSPLSTADAQFLEWFGTTIARRDRRVVVKRTWRDMVSAVVGSPW